jgi:hypothetical protein
MDAAYTSPLSSWTSTICAHGLDSFKWTAAVTANGGAPWVGLAELSGDLLAWLVECLACLKHAAAVFPGVGRHCLA